MDLVLLHNQGIQRKYLFEEFFLCLTPDFVMIWVLNNGQSAQIHAQQKCNHFEHISFFLLFL